MSLGGLCLEGLIFLILRYVRGPAVLFFQFLGSQLLPTIPFGIACTFSDNLSRNSCIFTGLSLTARERGFLLATMSVAPGYFCWKIKEK